VHAVLKDLELDPHPSTLGADPAEFCLLARIIVGEPGTPGDELFDITVCTPEWLSEAARRDSGIYNPRHHLIVDFEQFDVRTLRAWLSAKVQETQADTWAEVAERLSRLGNSEFEDLPE
jgi:hypothetical protein